MGVAQVIMFFMPQGVTRSIAEYECWLAKQQSEGALPGGGGGGGWGKGRRLWGCSRMGAAGEGGGLCKFEDMLDASDGSGADDQGMDYGESERGVALSAPIGCIHLDNGMCRWEPDHTGVRHASI